MRRRKRIPTPLLLMAAVLVAALASTAVRRAGLPRSGAGGGASQPEDAILAAFDAAKRGDARAYVGRFRGKLKVDLQRTREEMGDEGFRRYLRESTAAVKGIALSDRAAAGEGKIRVRVEYVYADKNDVQYYTVCPEGAVRRAWRIGGISASERARTLIPYGTAAVPLKR